MVRPRLAFWNSAALFHYEPWVARSKLLHFAALLAVQTSLLQQNVTIRREIVWGWLAHTTSSFLRTFTTLVLAEA
eukprot:1146460-Amphidinium_carterae.2